MSQGNYQTCGHQLAVSIHTLSVMFYALPKVLCSNKHFPLFWQIRHPLKLKFNETATELFNHGSKDRETLTSKHNKINK